MDQYLKILYQVSNTQPIEIQYYKSFELGCLYISDTSLNISQQAVDNENKLPQVQLYSFLAGMRMHRCLE